LNTDEIAYVTGVSGFVGRALANYLTGQGWVVRGGSLRLMNEPGKWQLALHGVRTVVHLASRVHQFGIDSRIEAAFQETNVVGTRFVIDQAVQAGVRRFVYMSSIKVNGEGGAIPYRGSDEPRPHDAYARSKLAAERLVSELCSAANLEFVIIRPPLVYGPGVKANFRKLLRAVDLGVPMPLASIDNRRSLVGMSNLVSFIELCMKHPRAAGASWLIADDECVSTPELLRKIAGCMQRRDRLFAFPSRWLRTVAAMLGRSGEMARLCDSLLVDSSAARNELGWRAATSLDVELARTVAAFRQEISQ
jgi:UDP-glucose 4-epimerase